MKAYAHSSCCTGHLRYTWNNSTCQEPGQISPRISLSDINVLLRYGEIWIVWIVRNEER